jgi:hypothetical protein
MASAADMTLLNTLTQPTVAAGQEVRRASSCLAPGGAINWKPSTLPPPRRTISRDSHLDGRSFRAHAEDGRVVRKNTAVIRLLTSDRRPRRRATPMSLAAR